MSRLVATAVLLLSTAAYGQTCFYNQTPEPVATGSGYELLGGNSFQLVGTNLLSQMLVSRFDFQNAPVSITGLALASASGSGQFTCDSLVVRMGLTNLDEVSDTFANNPAVAMQTVVDVHDYAWTYQTGTWSEIGLQTPYLYTPAAGNLLIEVHIKGMDAATRPRLYRSSGFGVRTVYQTYATQSPTTGFLGSGAPCVRLCVDRDDLSWHGIGCAGSSGTAPGLGFRGSARRGNQLEIVLSNALPNEAALLVYGLDTRPPFPLELDGIGMTGCRQYFGVMANHALLTDAAGTAVHVTRMPTRTIYLGKVLYAQFFVLDAAANPAGVVATNYGRIQIGR